MQISLEQPKGLIIRHYEPGEIQINETFYHQNIILTPNEVLMADFQQFPTQKDYSLIQQRQPEVVLIGLGAEMPLPHPETLAYFAQYHIGCEIMTTIAACRTYNVLMAEGRRVIAVLVI